MALCHWTKWGDEVLGVPRRTDILFPIRGSLVKVGTEGSEGRDVGRCTTCLSAAGEDSFKSV